MGTLIVTSFLTIAMAAVQADSSFGPEDQAIWIDRFNSFRTRGLPWSAGNMRRIGWNSDLTMSAASTAAKCSATTAPGVNVYQSSSLKSSNIIDEAIQQWVVDTSMKTLPTLEQPGASGVEIGKSTYNSYSQIIWAATTSVGCASATCPGGEMAVCEFSPAGNDGSSAWYIHANTASMCPSGTMASQGLCIVEGEEANKPIAPIPVSKLTYEVYSAYVANMQTVLIETARSIANGKTQTPPTVPDAVTTATSSSPTATTAALTSSISKTSSDKSKKDSSDTKSSATDGAPPSSISKTSSHNLKKDSSETKSGAIDGTPPSSISGFSISSSESSSSLKKHDMASASASASASSAKRIDKSSTSSSSTDPSEETSTKKKSQTTKPLPDDGSGPGRVNAGLNTGSTFTNQDTSAKKILESPTRTPSTDSNESTPASTSGGLSLPGIAGMIVLALIVVAAVGVVVSYKKNQRRQREIMRDGGIRNI